MRARRLARRLAVAELPFYRERMSASGEPRPWVLEDLEEFAARSGDPFAGRMRPGAPAPVALQLEATSEPAVWAALDGRELGRWAAGIARLWTRWGIERGEAIAFFDYGSSPLVLLSSASYVPWLRRGAADRLGLTAVCNDGVATMAERMVTIVRHVRPAAIVCRRDVLAPFGDALRSAGAELRGVRWVAVGEPEGAPPPTAVTRFGEEWQVRVHRILRSDAAFFIAGDCDRCGRFHVDGALYDVETTDGDVIVSARFARRCPAVGYSIGSGELVRQGCEREPGAIGIALR